jgi:hypothetical protein
VAASYQVLSGANPTIASYNVSVVKIYNAKNSIARFLNKDVCLRCKNAPAYNNALVVNSKVVGLAPGLKSRWKMGPAFAIAYFLALSSGARLHDLGRHVDGDLSSRQPRPLVRRILPRPLLQGPMLWFFNKFSQKNGRFLVETKLNYAKRWC